MHISAFGAALRTPDLRPVLIEGEEATFARNTFIAYWIRAGDDTSRWIDPDEIDCFDDF